MYKKNLLLVLVLILALSFSGCLSSLFGGKPTVLEVTPNEVEISLNAEDKTVELTAVVKNDKGEVMKVKETDIKWVIADVEEVEETTENGDGEEEIGPVATLSKQTGSKVTVEGKRVGEAGITVSFKKLTATVDVVVTEEPEVPQVDKSDLVDLIGDAETLKAGTPVGEEPGQAPEAAHTAFQAAIDAAKTVNENADATQEQVDDAIENLNGAITTFRGAIVVDPKAGLIETITEAEGLKDATQIGINNGQAPVHAHAAFQTAIDQAIAIKDKEDATQEEIDGAVEKLISAKTEFENAIVTSPDPLNVFTFALDRLSDTFTTDGKGIIEFNEDMMFIKTGTQSLKHTIVGTPSPFRIRIDKRDDWVKNWTAYDHLAVWVYVSDTEKLNRDTAFQFAYPMSTVKITLKRSAFINGWNELVFNLRNELNLTEEQLADMSGGLFEFLLRADTNFSWYFDEIRLLQLEEPIVEPEPLLFENFEGLADVDEFWTAAYKSLPGDETKPLYYQTGGTFTLVDDGLKLDGGRFTIGMPDDRGATTSADIDAGGTFDLSKPYKITVEFTGVEGTLTKKFQVYIDNNTTSAGSSIHNSIGSTASRPYSKELSGLPEGGVIELSPSVGTENSFVQLRVETSGIIVIKNFTIEHI